MLKADIVLGSVCLFKQNLKNYWTKLTSNLVRICPTTNVRSGCYLEVGEIRPFDLELFSYFSSLMLE